jgi:hypothetical protein
VAAVPAEPLSPAFCGDDELGYRRSRTAFVAGAGLALDEAYRLAHLPLVAPDHPRAIARKDGAFYDMGRHPEVFSLVVPVPPDALEAAPAYRALQAELRAAPFVGKLAWDLLPRRRDRLHATVCGSLSTGAPIVDEAARRGLAGLAPFAVELRGLFSGNVNVGRLYLKLYPERAGDNRVRGIQRLLGRRETDLYVVGLHNLVDDLAPTEAAALDALLRRWWDEPILRFTVDRLWLLAARDDLVLDSRVVEEFRLG